MWNHGILVIGNTVAETFNRIFYFERTWQTYLLALQTGQPLSIHDNAIADKTTQELEAYPGQDARHLAEVQAVLDKEGSNYATWVFNTQTGSMHTNPKTRNTTLTFN